MSEYLKECEKENAQQIALLFALVNCTCVDNLEERKKQIKSELEQLRLNLFTQTNFLVNCL